MWFTIGQWPELSQIPKLDAVRLCPRQEDVVQAWTPGFKSVLVVTACHLKYLVNFVTVNPRYDLRLGLFVQVDDPQGSVGASGQHQVWVELVDGAERVDRLAVVQLDGCCPLEPEVIWQLRGGLFGLVWQSDLVDVEWVGTRREQELVLEVCYDLVGIRIHWTENTHLLHKGSISVVQLTSYWTGLDLKKQVNL